MRIKADKDKFVEWGKRCHEAGKNNAVDCYKLIHGEIPYTAEDKKEWAEFMKQKFSRKGKTFDANNYAPAAFIDNPATRTQ